MEEVKKYIKRVRRVKRYMKKCSEKIDEIGPKRAKEVEEEMQKAEKMVDLPEIERYERVQEGLEYLEVFGFLKLEGFELSFGCRYYVRRLKENIKKAEVAKGELEDVKLKMKVLHHNFLKYDCKFLLSKHTFRC